VAMSLLQSSTEMALAPVLALLLKGEFEEIVTGWTGQIYSTREALSKDRFNRLTRLELDKSR